MAVAWRTTRGARREGGFGFIEVMISLLLVMVAAAAGVAVLGATIHATSFANGVQAASRLGQDVIDRAMAQPFDSLTGAAGDPVCKDPVDRDASNNPVAIRVDHSRSDETSGGSAGNYALYTRRCYVTVVSASYKRIGVVVSWVDGGSGRNHRVIMGMNRAR
jgi:Tfp pilus assembly protein PilV